MTDLEFFTCDDCGELVDTLYKDNGKDVCLQCKEDLKYSSSKKKSKRIDKGYEGE